MSESDPPDTAETIRRRRSELGLSQTELAERVGRTPTTIRRWEKGEAVPAPDVIDRLAHVLEVDSGSLGGADDPSREGPEASPSPPGVVQQETVTKSVAPPPSPGGAVPLTEMPTEAAPAPVPAGPRRAASRREEDTAPPARRLSLTRRRSVTDSGAALSYIEDRRQRLRYWLRYLLTAVAVLIMLVVLVWAFGELRDALGEVWQLFQEETPDTSVPGTDF